MLMFYLWSWAMLFNMFIYAKYVITVLYKFQRKKKWFAWKRNFMILERKGFSKGKWIYDLNEVLEENDFRKKMSWKEKRCFMARFMSKILMLNLLIRGSRILIILIGDWGNSHPIVLIGDWGNSHPTDLVME